MAVILERGPAMGVFQRFWILVLAVFKILLLLLLIGTVGCEAEGTGIHWQTSKLVSKTTESHSCIHDDILEQRRRLGRKEYSVTPQNYQDRFDFSEHHRKGRGLLATSNQGSQLDKRQPIRIFLNYDAVGHSPDRDCRNAGDVVKLGEPSINASPGVPACNSHAKPPVFGDCWYNCTAEDISGEDKKKRLRKALGETAAWFRRALAVEPVKGRLRLSGYSACGQDGGVQLPRQYVDEGIASADLVLLVTTRPTTGNTLAWAVACERDQWGRAIAGHVNVAPRHLTAQSETLLSATLIHEVMHVLGFDPHAFTHFRDERRQRRSQVVTKSFDAILGRTVTRVVLPRVIMHSRLHYGAFSKNFTGLELEDGGGRGTSGSHWEKRLLMNEIMTGSVDTRSVVSPMTLALLEDSGWYRANYSMAEGLDWGRNQGFSFITEPCNLWKGAYRCNSTHSSGCTYNREAEGYCPVVSYSNDLPPWARYFPQANKGGQSSLADYCAYFVAYSDGSCTDTNSARAPDRMLGEMRLKVAAVMSKNGFFKQKVSERKSNLEPETQSASDKGSTDDVGRENGGAGGAEENAASTVKNQSDFGGDLSFGASLLRMEGHKKRTAIILESFRNSHFFVRITRTDEPLWGKRTDPFTESSEFVNGKDSSDNLEVPKTTQRHSCLSAVIEGGRFDPSSAGGIARNAVTCCSLSNGDVVVELQVTVATDITDDAVLEVLQFEKYQTSSLSSTNVGAMSSQLRQENDKDLQDPWKELLQWLLPLDRPLPPPVPLSPPLTISNSFSGNSNQRPPSSGTSASTFFSFGHHRSGSTSSLPQGIQSLAPILSPSNCSSNFGLEDWDRLASQKLIKPQEVGSEGLLSFRGASLEPQRFSVHCGLEGLYVPGKRWRRKLEIVQPVEVHSYFADCNSEDLICVSIKNVVPAHLADVAIFVDSISIICEAAESGSPPVSVPIACIEVGDEHSLPGLPLRRGEQHSLILKPTTSMWKSTGTRREKSPGAQGCYSHAPGNSASSRNAFSRNNDGKRGIVESDQQESGQYAVLVSCRCTHTESRLYFKHSTQWQPRTPRDLLISVESEISTPAIGSDGSLAQLSAQVLTLQATNLTENDLSLTVLAPGSMASLPSVVSMNSTPTTPRMGSFMNFSEGKGRPGTLDSEDSDMTTMARLQSTSLPSVRPIESVTGMTPLALREQNISAADIMADSSSACTHLWLQSTVPLGCVPSHSTTTVRLELLPLTDGIITLDTLQISAKDRGIRYVPEKPLKIYSTSSIASGII